MRRVILGPVGGLLALALGAAERPWQRAPVAGGEIEYQIVGRGDPILFIHGSVVAEAFAPLRREPALRRFLQVHYHRRGFAGSDRAHPPFSIRDEAADARALLAHLGVERPHIVGHSYGAAIAMQLALDEPAAVRSLVLLEPPLFPHVASAAAAVAEIGPPIEAFRAGEREKAVDLFMRFCCGPGYREALDRNLSPRAFTQAVEDVGKLFEVEFPALEAWTFGPEEAAKVRVPVLSVVGTDSAPIFREGHDVIRRWWPEAGGLVVPGATHALQLMNPRVVAEGIARFLRAQERTRVRYGSSR